ncbi:2180_t:CDS:2, partial [Gigaspora rosea]
GRELYVALILSANDVPTARKIYGHASYAIKCYHCTNRATYGRGSRKITIVALPPLDKKVYRSLKMTENFEKKNL